MIFLTHNHIVPSHFLTQNSVQKSQTSVYCPEVSGGQSSLQADFSAVLNIRMELKILRAGPSFMLRIFTRSVWVSSRNASPSICWKEPTHSWVTCQWRLGISPVKYVLVSETEKYVQSWRLFSDRLQGFRRLDKPTVQNTPRHTPDPLKVLKILLKLSGTGCFVKHHFRVNFKPRNRHTEPSTSENKRRAS